jgi:hypothetical protein
MAASDAWRNGYIETIVFALYDFDAAGRRAARSIENGLSESTDAPITFELLAVTEEQISDRNLPTRPAKVTDPEADKFGADAVEPDAIPQDPARRTGRGRDPRVTDTHEGEKEQAVEASECALSLRLTGEQQVVSASACA